MLHRARPFVRGRLRDNWRGNDHGFAPHFRSRRAPGKIDIRVSLESISLHRFATDRTELIIAWAFVHDGRVVVSDVSDVGRLVDNRHAALRREQRLLHSRRAKFAARDETILVGADVIIIVGPIVNAGVPVESRFRRQWRPTDVIGTLAP